MTQKILIVDDSRTSRMFIQQALEIAGFEGAQFIQAANGHDALTALASEGPFRLMVTGINMPGKGGMELIADLRELPQTKDLTVVVISSTQSTIRDAALKQMGVFAILEKPINMQKVMATFAPLQQGA